MLADKGWRQCDAIRHDLRDSGATPDIPTGEQPQVHSIGQPSTSCVAVTDLVLHWASQWSSGVAATRYGQARATKFTASSCSDANRVTGPRFVHRA